jgi:TusA-related sulfurtransferase
MSLDVTEQLDLRGVPCPANSARILVTLATMDSGQVLEAWIDSGEPIENVPPAIEAANYKVLEKTPIENFWSLKIEA